MILKSSLNESIQDPINASVIKTSIYSSFTHSGETMLEEVSLFKILIFLPESRESP